MSAFPDDPAHFARWMAAQHPGTTPAAFVARATYGAYLRDTLAQVRVAAADRLEIVTNEVRAIDRPGGAARLTLCDGTTLSADAIVLTLGNLPPHAPPGIDADALSADVYVPDPWTQDWVAGLSPDDHVVLVGSGLTAIDMALHLDAAGFAGPILALSRRALSPRRHIDGTAPALTMPSVRASCATCARSGTSIATASPPRSPIASTRWSRTGGSPSPRARSRT